ncbi:DEAD/DEAH box helicase [Halalkalibacter sp. AB-rgal2]|uniref:DEAD/DEAH box helicase n=1 Tax=Halalkalibacter sp. AB-rgal2 TaxID=3242695 RepID=UPI00359D96D6
MKSLIGRRLLRSEIRLEDDELESLIEKGAIIKEKALLHDVALTCRRCGNQESHLFARHHCVKCERSCTYCRHCLLLGKISECESLYRWNGSSPVYPKLEKPMEWSGTLSPAQQRASDAVEQTVIEKKEMLVWAVCGSGKTEVIFKGIERALVLGKRVLVATPRTDVVKELLPRFQKSFPNVTISALYGGSRDRKDGAQFVLATTHQVMRFYDAFDWIVVDEVDAFPFSYDQSLRYAIQAAKREDASLVYLSATPSREWTHSPHIERINIPKRYHGHPLPLPQFTWCGNWQKKIEKGQLPQCITKWLEKMQKEKKPILLFVSSVRMLHSLSRVLQSHSFKHENVHAKETKRHPHIQAFRQQQIPILVTTTILERGVTFTDVQVGIVGAEQDVFTEAALVQIAGRVGRHHDYPAGDVMFFHYGISKEMRLAYQHIELMNREGGF